MRIRKINKVAFVCQGCRILDGCYVETLLVFAEQMEKIDQLENKQDGNLIMTSLKTSGSFKKTEVFWKKSTVYLKNRG